jgi:hypothetical protein
VILSIVGFRFKLRDVICRGVLIIDMFPED